MKKPYILFLVIFCMACNSTDTTKTTSLDSLNSAPAFPSDSIQDSSEKKHATREHTLLELNQVILTGLQEKNYAAVESHIHPDMGLLFSPYADVNLLENLSIPKTEFLKALNSTDKKSWGQFDGTGDPIELSLLDYMNKFVYDVDFLHAEKVSVNSSISKGNILNNINTVYPNAEYVENYFSGFNPDYQGMDWRALRLVFKKEGNKYFLIALVHDQWTT